MLETTAIDQRQAAAPSRGRAGSAAGDAFALLLGSATAADSAPAVPRSEPRAEAKRQAKAAAESSETKPQAQHKPKASKSDSDSAERDGESPTSTPATTTTNTTPAAAEPTVDPSVAVATGLPDEVSADPSTETTKPQSALADLLAQTAAGGQPQTAPAKSQGDIANSQQKPAAAPEVSGTKPQPGVQAAQPQPLTNGQSPTAAAANSASAATQPTPEQSAAAAVPVQAPAGGKSRTAEVPAQPSQGAPATGVDQQVAANMSATPTAPAQPATPATPATAAQPATQTAPAQPATPAMPAQPAAPAEQAAAADPDLPELPSAAQAAATAKATRPNATGSGPAEDSNPNKRAGKTGEPQTTAQRAEALAERLAGTTAAERNFQAYLQRVSEGQVQGTQAPIADDGAPQSLPAQQQAANAAASDLGAPISASTARPVPAPGTQVAVQVHSALTNRLQRFSIRLEPAELGRVDVRLEFHRDGQVRATISAERSETLDLLQKDVHNLERALRDAGTNTTKLSFSFDLQNGGRQNASHNGGQASNNAGGDAAANNSNDGDEPMADPGTPVRRLDGLIDIEV